MHRYTLRGILYHVWHLIHGELSDTANIFCLQIKNWKLKLGVTVLEDSVKKFVRALGFVQCILRYIFKL